MNGHVWLVVVDDTQPPYRGEVVGAYDNPDAAQAHASTQWGLTIEQWPVRRHYPGGDT